MIYLKFKDYEGFKRIFGKRECGNGAIQRQNSFLLEQIKYKPFFNELRKSKGNAFSFCNSVLNCRCNEDLFNLIYLWMRCDDANINVKGTCLQAAHSDEYMTDGQFGICLDGTNNIRYINIEKNLPFRMKPGKFFRQVLLGYEFSEYVSPKVINYMAEKFTEDFVSSIKANDDKYTLHLGDDESDFSHIYSSLYCRGNFHSCMVDKKQHYFYRDAVDAKAAWLENDRGEIVARCIIFTRVFDEEGNKYRYAERQYSTNCDDSLKQILVRKLIEAGEIDMYKQIGAGCGDSRNIVNNSGDSLSGTEFHIKCYLETGDVLSYQDTFKYYDEDEEIAYNSAPFSSYESLDTTDPRFREDKEWDSYHERWCDETTVVYAQGREYTCDTNDLDDFCYVESKDNNYHIDDCFMCEHCGSWELCDNVNYSELLDKDFCCQECLDKAELRYKESHWFWSEYDEEYFEEPNKIIHFLRYGEWISKTICEESLDDNFECTIFVGGEYYDVNSLEEFLDSNPRFIGDIISHVS